MANEIEFPLAGGVYRVDYGDLVIRHDYTTDGKVTYTIEGPEPYVFTADIEVAPIREDVFAVTFQDDFARVVMVEDTATGAVNTFMAMKNGSFQHVRGTFTRV